MDTRVPMVTGKVKEGNNVSTYVGNTRTILDLLNSDRMTQGWNGGGTSEIICHSRARKSEAQENCGSKCEFDKSLEVIFLRPIYFILISLVSPLEKSRHSFVGEAAAVRSAIGIFLSAFGEQSSLCYLIVVDWKIFESEANVPHMVHRWRDKLLQYQLVLWHRSEMMMWECNMMLQYNKATQPWR